MTEGSFLLISFLSLTYLIQAFLFGRPSTQYHVFYDYYMYIRDILLFRTGYTSSGVRVNLFIYPGLVNSLSLLLPALIISLLVSFVLVRGVYIYGLKKTWSALTVLSSWFTLLPVFWLGLLFLAVSIASGILPAGGVESHYAIDMNLSARILNRIYHLILPFLSLALPMIVHLSVSGKQQMDTEQKSPAVKTLISQGMTKKGIFRFQISRPLTNELLLQAGAYLPMLISMMVLVERVFVYSGLGTLAVSAYQARGMVQPVHAPEVTQSALAYLGVISILFQYLIRLLRGMLYPEISKQTTQSSRKRIGMLLAVIFSGQIAVLIFGRDFASQSLNPLLIERIVFLFISCVIICRVLIGGNRSRKTAAISSGNGHRSVNLGLKKNLYAWTLKDISPLFAVAAAAVLILLVSAWFVPVRVALRPLMRGSSAADLSWWASLWQRGSLFGRSIIAARFLVIPLSAALAGSLLGAAGGVLQGMYGKKGLETGVRFLEMFPSVLLVIMFSGLLTGSIWGLLIPLTVISALRMYRIISWEVHKIRDMEYMEYSRMLGASLPGLITSHLLPQLSVLWMRNAIRLFCDAVVIEANMSFLARLYSLGPSASAMMPVEGWGVLMRDARYQFIRGQWSDIIIPAVIFLVFLGSLRILSEVSPLRRSLS
ncbi:hypothetical protein JCM12856_28820 [Spirochaeta dissipatitropha]